MPLDPYERVRQRIRQSITLRAETLILVMTAFMVATANGSWWRVVMAGRAWSDPGTWGFVAACFVTLVAIHFALIAIIANRWIVRPLLTLFVVAAAAAAYYMQTFAIFLDPTMIQNVIRTDAREARDLVSLGMIAWIVGWSVLPVAFIWWVKLAPQGFTKAILVRAGSVTAALLVAVLATMTMSRDFTSLMRNQREARYLVTPANLIYGVGVNTFQRAAVTAAPREIVGADAKIVRVAAAARPRVLVLVVGETARAANFSLLGYARETNPELKKLGVTAFSQVRSCGTSTETSVPCMFSPYGRRDYDERRIRSSEGLLDVVARAGYAVKWVDNQSGCKGVCAGKGVEVSRLDSTFAPELCDGKECLDAILQRRLEVELDEVRGDTLIVLHMMGNHGPAYFKRYPPEFRRFEPDCATAQLRDCTREQVVNAYDNAILYTDHVLASLVGSLDKRSGRIDGAMLYVSDHGESLGEKGLYLHGIPYAIAPSQQTHVPMILWLSSNITTSGDVSARCMSARAGEPYSHDNLFHSVLGLLNVSTGAYRSERDIFDGCRGGSFAVQSVSESNGKREKPTSN